jgi:hypothetical protein
VAFLGTAESHARERPGDVEALETHMSWVFLTDHFAYKLKKAVRHALIDLRPLEAGHRNCLVEPSSARRTRPLSAPSASATIAQTSGRSSAASWFPGRTCSRFLSAC